MAIFANFENALIFRLSGVFDAVFCIEELQCVCRDVFGFFGAFFVGTLLHRMKFPRSKLFIPLKQIINDKYPCLSKWCYFSFSGRCFFFVVGVCALFFWS